MDWTLRYHLVAFIDVLGQSNALLGLSRLPFTEDEKGVAARVLRDTASYILQLREAFVTLAEARNKPTGILDGLAADKRAAADELRRVDYKMTGLSDTVVISVPLSNENAHCLSVTSVAAVLYGICGMSLAALRLEKPLRCGIAIGLGVELGDNEIYGPALVEAYSLENQVAQHPRAVVGESLWDYLNMVESQPPTNLAARFARTQAALAKSFLAVDCDGVRIVDIAGPGVKSIEGIDPLTVQKAYEFTVANEQVMAARGDAKLAARYGTLRRYLESRLHAWDIHLPGLEADSQ